MTTKRRKNLYRFSFFLALVLHLTLISGMIWGIPFLKTKKELEIPYSVKLFEPREFPKKEVAKNVPLNANANANANEIKKQQKKEIKKAIKEKKTTTVKHIKKAKKTISKITKKKVNKKAISLKPKKEKKKTKRKVQKKKKKKTRTASTKKKSKSISQEEILKKRIEAIKREIKEKQEEDYLKRRLASLEKKVKGQKGGVAGQGGASGGLNDQLRLYARLIWIKVRRNWHFPESLLNKGDVEAIISIKIAPDGRIISKRFEKTSGFPAFDRSVLKAISDSNPLPPLPRSIGKGPIEIGIRFNPKRMNS